MYLTQQMAKVASHQQLVEALEVAHTAIFVASIEGDLASYDLFKEVAGLIQGELILRLDYVTGKDLGQISKWVDK